MKRVTRERNLAAHMMKGNTLREIDELTCVVGALVKVKKNNQEIELGKSSGALAA